MVPYSNPFSAELAKTIRGRGHCRIKIWSDDYQSLTDIDEYYIESVEIVSENDPLSRSLPTETATIRLIDFEMLWHPENPDGYSQDIEPLSHAWIAFGIENDAGTVLWGPDMVYEITKKPDWGNYRATFKMTHKIGSMTGEFNQFRGIDTNLLSLATKICNEAGLDNDQRAFETAIDLIPIIVDTSMSERSYADSLLAIAVAANCSIRTSFDDIIFMDDTYQLHPQKNPLVITSDDMFSLPEVEIDPKLRSEDIEIMIEHSGLPAEDETVIKTTTTIIPTATNHFFAKFDRPILPASWAEANRASHNIANIAYSVYRDGLDITSVTPVDPTQPYTIEGTAKPQTQQTEARTVQINADGTDNERLNNPFLNESNYAAVAAYRGDYLSNTRSKYTISYRGNPTVEALDIIRIKLPFAGVCHCIVLSATFSYNGTFSGKLTVRKLDSVTVDQTINTAISDYALSDSAVSDTE